MDLKLNFSLLIYCALITLISSGGCGYDSCKGSDANKLNVHLVPHSHDDVGWLKTVDSYYQEDVNQIITNVVKSLVENPIRTFTQVEIYFFNRWWKQQNDDTKNVVRKLVNDGQLSFANGGWCVNDEGVAYYNQIIDQMTLGLRVLNELFGECGHPKVSWQIDPFGASKEMAALYALMGFDGHVTNRGIRPQGEFIWRGNHDLGQDSEIFTTNLHLHYSPPPGFDFDKVYNSLMENNKLAKSEDFVGTVKDWNLKYGKTNHVLVPMGDDFQYKNADRWYKNMDVLIETVNENFNDVNVFYSSPQCYFYALNQLNRTFDSRSDDYLNYWVGYYSSRPTLKQFDRIDNNLLQASKQLDTFAGLDSTRSALDEAKNEEAIFQHHDAVTGTSPQNTSDDYQRRLFSGMQASEYVMNKVYSKLLQKNGEKFKLNQQVFCDTLNFTSCQLPENHTNIAITIYNPIARKVSQWFRIPVSTRSIYELIDPDGYIVNNTELVPISESVIQMLGPKNSAKYEFVFKAQIPALGLATYLLERKSISTFEQENSTISHKKCASIHEMKGKGFTLQLDAITSKLTSIKINDGKTYPLHQSLMYYTSCGGVSGIEDSGSYNFCPNGTARSFGSVNLESKIDSGLIHEVRQEFSDWAKQTIRVYEDEEFVEFDWVVGPIPVYDGVGREVISRFETNLKNNKVFYTDANGRQMVRRIRDPNARICGGNNISGNWYPIYSRIYIRDEEESLQLTVMNDRTQGGSSIIDGTVELMVHRRLTHNGAGGFFVINETGINGEGLVVRGKHYLFFKPINESAHIHRHFGEKIFMPPIVSLSEYQSETEYRNNFHILYSALIRELPPNIHLLTLERWKQNQVLIRLEHFFENSDETELSKKTEVDLKNLFKPFYILNVTETTLGANQVLEETRRLTWNQKISSASDGIKRGDFRIQLTSQQIRTFIVTINGTNNNEEKCSANWMTISGTQIPNNAIIIGYDIGKSAVYFCRHKVNDFLITGKLTATKSSCEIYHEGSHYQFFEGYEILVGKNIDWVPVYGNDPVPENALNVGKDLKGNSIYIARCAVNYGTQSQHNDIIYYKFSNPHDGQQENENCFNHEILTC